MVAQTTRKILANLRQATANRLSPKNRQQIGAFLKTLQQNPIGQWYEHQSADAYLISFPKCGRTWLRLMLGRAFVKHFHLSHPNLMQKMLELSSLSDLHPEVPKILISHDDDPHWKKPEELHRNKKFYQEKKIIFLVRDPKDVVVSAYFEQKKRAAFWVNGLQKQPHLKKYRDRLKSYEGSISEFLYEPVGSLDTILTFYQIWEQNHHIPKEFLLVRYEDLHQQPNEELQRILKFLGVPNVPPEIIQDAVNYSSFDNMRKMETENKFNSLQLSPSDKKDETSYKTRKGKVGGFVEYFNEDEIQYIDGQIRQSLSSFFGYN